MVYSFVYDMPYFIENIYKQKIKKDILNCREKINFIYLYYLDINNKMDEDLKNKILEKYKNKTKKIQKEINELDMIKFDIKLIIKNNKKYNDEVVKKASELRNRADIIAECIEYKVLIKYLNLDDNKKIDRLLNWNISRMKKFNTIEDKIWLM